MADDALRRALAGLARATGSDPSAGDGEVPTDDHRTFRETIERAVAATDDREAAAAFVDETGLDELERAVERAEESVSACAADGRRALRTFREFRDAAAGVPASDASAGSTCDGEESPGDYFHRGHGTSLGGGDIARSK